MGCPLDEVLAALRSGLEAKRAEGRERVRRICEAAEVYGAAVEAQLAANLAAAAGLPAPPAHITPEVALIVLRGEVEGLAIPFRSTAAVTTSAAPRSKPEAADPRPEAQAEAKAPQDDRSEETELIVNFSRLELSSLSDEVFRTYAEEFAARVRHLQLRGLSNPLHVEGASRIIRTLSAMAYRRGMWDVFGLSRRDEGDWLKRAEVARAERTMLMSAQPASVLSGRAEARGPLEVDDEEEDPLALPRLARATVGRPVVIVGGIERREELDQIRLRSGVALEWVPPHGGLHGADGLGRRITDGAVTAVIVLEGLVGQSITSVVVASAKAAGIPVVQASKPDQAALARALKDLETRLFDLPPVHP